MWSRQERALYISKTCAQFWNTTICIWILSNKIGSLNIFVVFTLKNLTFSYSDFMVFFVILGQLC